MDHGLLIPWTGVDFDLADESARRLNVIKAIIRENYNEKLSCSSYANSDVCSR